MAFCSNSGFGRLVDTDVIYTGPSITCGGTTVNPGDTVREFISVVFLCANDIVVNVEGNSLPTPDGTGNKVAFVGSGTYTKAGQSDVVVPSGHMGILNWDGSVWYLGSSVEMPEQTGVDTINPNGDGLTKEKAVAKYVNPLYAMISGGEVQFGDDDFDEYTTNNPQEYIFLHRAFPIDVQGTITQANAVFHRAGAYNVYIARPVSGQPQRFTMLGKSPQTATVGINNITLYIPTMPGDLLAIGQVSGGALLKTKVGTDGLWLNTTSSNADVPNGTEVAFSGSGRIMAVNFIVSIGGIHGDLSDINSRIDDVEDEFSSVMKEAYLTVEKSLNMFDPSKIVDGRYISSTGSVATVPGWQLILINIEDLEDGQDITFNGINPSMPSYYGFYTTDDGAEIAAENLIPGSNGTFSSNPVTVQKPTGAVSFGITIKRPGNTESVYANAVINLGDTPIPYQPYSGDVIVKYKDLKFAGGGGGEAYDQSLNTTDNVEFNSVTTHALLAELPEGSGIPPSGVLTGQAWIDTTDDSIKVRRS